MSHRDCSILRLLDANANRAREALRVIEDYARFVLDDGDLSAALKKIRHDMADALGGILAEAIFHRDTLGDVGTLNKTESELHRSGIHEVVTAAGKRLGEALRAIEEYLKTIDPVAAGKIESLRYYFYEIERRLALRMRPAWRFADVRLCALITESCCQIPWLDAAEQAILGGADCLQLREKSLESGELLSRARQFVTLCRRYSVISIINDRPDIAWLSGADGVHLGQSDLPAPEARKILGKEKLIGVSTHEIRDARRAVTDGADYIGVGPIFRSPTKPRDFVAGLEYARQVASEIPIPALAIAGITAANVQEVMATGIKAIAVTAAVISQSDIRAAAEELKKRLAIAAARPGIPPEKSPRVGNFVRQAFLSVSPDIEPVPLPLSQSEFTSTRRKLPHWRVTGATYFITFRLFSGELSSKERALVLEHVKLNDPHYYNLLAAVVMPDHIHLLLRPNPGIELSRITKGTKGVTAERINEMRGTRGWLWQDESWDRIIRDATECNEKLDYMLTNPIKKGLVEDGWQYDGWYLNPKVDEQ